MKIHVLVLCISKLLFDFCKMEKDSFGRDTILWGHFNFYFPSPSILVPNNPRSIVFYLSIRPPLSLSMASFSVLLLLPMQIKNVRSKPKGKTPSLSHIHIASFIACLSHSIRKNKKIKAQNQAFKLSLSFSPFFFHRSGCDFLSGWRWL